MLVDVEDLLTQDGVAVLAFLREMRGYTMGARVPNLLRLATLIPDWDTAKLPRVPLLNKMVSALEEAEPAPA